LEALQARGVMLPAALADYRMRVTARRAYTLALCANAIPTGGATPIASG
jgi:hypothetical protein